MFKNPRFMEGQKIVHNVYGVGTIKYSGINNQGELYYEAFFDGLGKKITVMREDDMVPLYDMESGKADDIVKLFSKIGLDAEKVDKIAKKLEAEAKNYSKTNKTYVIPSPFKVGFGPCDETKIIKGGDIAKALKEMGEIKPVFGKIPKTFDSVKRHHEIVTALNELYARKNADYGDSFYETFKEEGLAMARIRLSDKLNRFKSLTKSKDQLVSDESILDTLDDLANYAVMTRIAIERLAAEMEVKA